PVIADAIDIGQLLIAWQEVANSAPLAVEAEWNTMIDAMETAATVDPNDPESVQKVADTARASEQSANRVITYTQQRCGLTIGGG
ncbi:MAG: hypothetical protein HY826_09915, partial [Actinobacteria bacterium]|nr:hypothetical protein [Actinomycetota bacterium]